MAKKILKTYKYCNYCGDKLLKEPRDHEFDNFTGEPLQWLICPKRTDEYNKNLGMNRLAYEERNKHARWVKENVTDVES